MASRRRKKQDEGPVGPDPLLVAEERLAAVFQHIAKRLMETAPDPNDPKAIPQTALDALCELHADYKEQAMYKRLALDEQQLEEKILQARAQKEAMVRNRKKMDPRKARGGKAEADEGEDGEGTVPASPKESAPASPKDNAEEEAQAAAS